MKPYQTIKFVEYPDVADIQQDGRKSSVGRLKVGEEYYVYPNGLVSDAAGKFYGILKTKRNVRGYLKPKAKRSIRRYLKRVDKRNINKRDQEES